MNKITLFSLLFLCNITQALTVMIVDSGIDLNHKLIESHVDFNHYNIKDYKDSNGHGTHVAGIILNGTCDEVKLISCRYFDNNYDFKNSLDNTINCFKLAKEYNVDVINYSAGGPDPSEEEYNILKQLSDNNVIIVVAAGNENQDLVTGNYYPAKYPLKNIFPVGSLNDSRIKSLTSNYGLNKMQWEKGERIFSTLPNGRFGMMSGTSQAAAKFTNKLLRKYCEYQH